MGLKLVYEREQGKPVPSARLVNNLTKEERAVFKDIYQANQVTDAVKRALLEELNNQLMPRDDKSSGWDIREAERHGNIRALKLAINLLP